MYNIAYQYIYINIIHTFRNNLLFLHFEQTLLLNLNLYDGCRGLGVSGCASRDQGSSKFDSVPEQAKSVLGLCMCL